MILDATLRFEIELLSIGNKPRSSNPYFSSSDDVFSEIDVDMDGYISFTELVEYFSKNKVSGRVKDVYEKEDINKDGIITWDEFSGPKLPIKGINSKHADKSESQKSDESKPLSAKAQKILSEVDVDIGWV